MDEDELENEHIRSADIEGDKTIFLNFTTAVSYTHLTLPTTPYV